jgi:1-phosphatidylinositol phosphodiesterase
MSSNRSVVEWMSLVDDQTPLTKLTIPGTHDSAAYPISYFAGAGFAKTQTLSFEQQLEVGVRFFDLRCRHVHDQLPLYHGCVALDQVLEDIMDTFHSFLLMHPSEVILISIHRASSPMGQNHSSFAKLVAQRTVERYPDMFVDCGSDSAGSLPATIGDARGKMILFRRFDLEDCTTLGSAIHVRLADNVAASSEASSSLEIHYQDCYNVPTIDFKLHVIGQHLKRATTCQELNKLHICFCSAVCTPPWYSLSRPVHFADGVNPWLSQAWTHQTHAMGIVIVDFVTAPLAIRLLNTNFEPDARFDVPMLDTAEGGCWACLK